MMNSKKLGYFFVGFSAVVALGGCAAPSFNGAPGSPAPAHVKSGKGLTWANASSFGAVPESEASRGNEACRSAFESTGKIYAAIGYHPEALDANGQPFVRGGFFCAPL